MDNDNLHTMLEMEKEATDEESKIICGQSREITKPSKNVSLIHGNNIRGKLSREKDKTNLELLKEIYERYKAWHENNMSITGTNEDNIFRKVVELNKYRNFVGQEKFSKAKGRKHGFSSQSQLVPSVIEEFLYYLFKDINVLRDNRLCWGRIDAYTNFYFQPRSLAGFIEDPNIVVSRKQQDFAISVPVDLAAKVSSGDVWQSNTIYIPIVSIECKTYLDKTMYEGSFSTAKRIKTGNPYALFIIVAETYSIASDVDPKYSAIDQIYVLRREKHKRDNYLASPISKSVVLDLFKLVKEHVESNWYMTEEKLKAGKLI